MLDLTIRLEILGKKWFFFYFTSNAKDVKCLLSSVTIFSSNVCKCGIASVYHQ